MSSGSKRLRTLVTVAALLAGGMFIGVAGGNASADIRTTMTVQNDELLPDPIEQEIQDDGLPARPGELFPGEADARDVDVRQTAAGAIRWFSSRRGSTAYEGYCERAVRLAWARRTHHASAIAHWRSNSDGVRHTTGRPPAGAFVFWNISRYGHVGIADGNGGFWSTGVRGRIDHRASTSHFRNYLGWKAGNSN